MFEELRTCRLTPDEVDNKTIQSICDIWSSAKSLTDGKKTDPGLMCTIYDNNSSDRLRREARRWNSGTYVVQRLGDNALLAAARMSIITSSKAPQYRDSQAGRSMYMEIFGASDDAEGAWPDYLKGMVEQARKDFDRSIEGGITKLCAYAFPDADERFADTIRDINPRTYEKHGGERGSFGAIGGVSGSYCRHDVEFFAPHSARVLARLGDAAFSLLVDLRNPIGSPVLVRA